MSQKYLGTDVRDRVSGVAGVVIGVVSWLHNPVDSLIVQPPAQPDGKVPSTVYVPESAAEPRSPKPPERLH